MDRYSLAMKKELLIEQFKGRPNIEALMEVLGEEFQEIADFYAQLKTKRDLKTAVGKQLDGVGNIVDLSRMEAGKLTGNPIPVEVISDDIYRRYLIYKILINTCNCTYPDIIKAFRMFWDKPLYYTEDLNQPATMIFRTGYISFEEDISALVKAPLVKAAGVGMDLGIVFEPVVLENRQAFWFSAMYISLREKNQQRMVLERLLLTMRARQPPGNLHLTSLRVSQAAEEHNTGLLERVLFHLRAHNFREIIYLDGRRLLDGTWLLNQGMIRGPALHQLTITMRTAGNRPKLSALVKMRGSAGRRGHVHAGGTYLMRGQTQQKARLPTVTVGTEVKNRLSAAGNVTTDTMWRLDGTYRLDGGKKLNAKIVRSEI